MKNKKLCMILSLLLSLSIVFATATISFAEYYNNYEGIYTLNDDDDDEYLEDDEDYEMIPGWDGEYSEDGEPIIEPTSKLKINNIKYNSATLTWKHSGNNVDGYKIYTYITKFTVKKGKIDYDWDKKLLDTIDNPNTQSYRMTNLVPLETYEVSVVAYKVLNGKEYTEEDFDDYTKTFTTPLCMKASFYSSNKKAGKNVIKVIKAYKSDQKFKGSGECYGYAEWGSKKIAKSRSYVTINKKITLKNVKKYIVGLKPGAHVRMTSKRMDHSILILKATEDRVYWADNNYGSYNRVHYHAGSIVDLYGMMSAYSKIAWIYKTKSYR